MKDIVQRIKRDLTLLWQSPKNYLYNLLVIPNAPVKIYAYNPKAEVIAQEIKEQITHVLKAAKVEFVGSAALKLPGYKDIDIFIPTSSKNLREYNLLLEQLFGKPAKRRKSFSEWHLYKKGYAVELMLIDKTHKAYTEQKKVFTILKRYKRIREEYIRLKLASKGISQREYQKKRMTFYNHLVLDY